MFIREFLDNKKIFNQIFNLILIKINKETQKFTLKIENFYYFISLIPLSIFLEFFFF